MHKVAKWGNSLAVRLPKAIQTKLEIKEGDEINFSIDCDGNIVMNPKSTKRELNKMLDCIHSGNLHHSVDWGKPKGGEVW